MSNCPGTILLDYTAYSDEILDDIAPDEEVNIYIFDQNNICNKIYTFTYGELQKINYEFEVPIKYNGHNAVVWHGNHSPDYSANRMKIGESLNDFYLRLIYNESSHKFTHVPDPLWASPLEPIDYCASKSRHRIHMTRIHTYVNVNLRQQNVDGSTFEIDMDDYITSIQSQNDVYHTDYSISGQSEMLEFNNAEELAANTFLDWAHVGTLRITPNMYCVLCIAPVGDPDNPISVGGTTKLDLVDYMLQSREADEESTEISDQRFLDLNKVWNIDLLLGPGNIAVSLTINGWTIWFDHVDLN